MSEAAEEIDRVIREFYRPAEPTGHVVEDSDNLEYWPDGDPATDIIQEIAGVEPEIAESIDKYLSDLEARDVRDGAHPYYGGEALEHIGLYPYEFMDIWERFEQRLKHEVRFFDQESKQLLDGLFEDLTSLADGKAIVTIEPGCESSTLYRARIATDSAEAESFLREPARQIGPPPPHLARAGRMNPAGIPVFYGAFSEEVAVAEVRPSVGSIVAVGKFSLLRPIRLLDISFLPFAYHRTSIFSPEYDHLRNKVGFLEKFHRRISRPVLPGDEALAYLPTQAVAAYMSNIMGLDGLIYASIQIGVEGGYEEQVDRKFCNVVLFGNAARVEGVVNTKATDHPIEPPIAIPGIGMGIIEEDPIEVPAAEVVPETIVPATAVEAAERPANSESTATLRIDPRLELVKIKSIKVATSPMFGHLYEDGTVIIDDYEEDE